MLVALRSLYELAAANVQSFTASGGLTSGGASAIVDRHADVASGGISTSGAATTTHRQIAIASAGLAAGGAAIALKRIAIVAVGGSTTGGASLFLHSQGITATGGVVSAGASAGLARRSVTASGGLVTSGGVTIAQRHVLSSSGGSATSGAAGLSARHVVAGNGGAATSGVAGLSHAQTAAGAGGVTSGGVAVTHAGRSAIAAGGATLAGAGAVEQRSTWNTVAGGLVTGGAAAVETRPLRAYVVAAGGSTSAGGAQYSSSYLQIGSGGATLGGTAGFVYVDGSIVPVPYVPSYVGGAAAGGLFQARRDMRERADKIRAAERAAEQPVDRVTPHALFFVASGGVRTGGAARVVVVQVPAFVLVRSKALRRRPQAIALAAIVDRYYADVAPVLLPHITGRPLMIKRWPHGLLDDPIYARDAPPDTPSWIRIVNAPRRKGGVDHRAIVVDSIDALEWITREPVELHPYGYHADAPHAPLAVLFDLDPGMGTTIRDTVIVAQQMRALLAAWDLEAFIKTSGSKGMHIVVPISGQTWHDVDRFARPLVKQLEAASPDTITSKLPRAERIGKTWIDWTANGRRRTLAAPFTWRHTTGEQISMPIPWDELDDRSLHITPADALDTIARHGDAWGENLFETVQTVPDLATIAMDDLDLVDVL